MGPDQAVDVFPEGTYKVDVDEIVKSLYTLRDSPLIFHFSEKSDDPDHSPPTVDGRAYELIGYLVTFKGARLDTTSHT